MTKDDYYVIVYRLLRYLYDCLKKGQKPSIEVLDADYFSIDASYWTYIIVNLSEGGYISGAPTFYSIGTTDKQVKISANIKITPEGIKYLEENSVFQKIKNAVKDISDILPI